MPSDALRSSLVCLDAPRLPPQYGTIRRCVEDLLAVPNETRYATVRGHDVLTGDTRTVTGQVVDVTLDAGYERAALSLDTEDGPVDVGGRAAALEDAEVHEIHVDRTLFDDRRQGSS
jgi:hypothetical protein